jgi:hypothetical protein
MKAPADDPFRSTAALDRPADNRARHSDGESGVYAGRQSQRCGGSVDPPPGRRFVAGVVHCSGAKLVGAVAEVLIVHMRH